jgi:hypothetical protein
MAQAIQHLLCKHEALSSNHRLKIKQSKDLNNHFMNNDIHAATKYTKTLNIPDHQRNAN